MRAFQNVCLSFYQCYLRSRLHCRMVLPDISETVKQRNFGAVNLLLVSQWNGFVIRERMGDCDSLKPNPDFFIAASL